MDTDNKSNITTTTPPNAGVKANEPSTVSQQDVDSMSPSEMSTLIERLKAMHATKLALTPQLHTVASLPTSQPGQRSVNQILDSAGVVADKSYPMGAAAGLWILLDPLLVSKGECPFPKLGKTNRGDVCSSSVSEHGANI